MTTDVLQQASSSSIAPKRAVCSRCRRPQRVCICATLPATPITLAGQVIILQHPHETKQKLATVPVLQLCLSPASLHVLVGRRVRPSQHSVVDEALLTCQQRGVPLMVLWPGPGAVCVDQLAMPASDPQQRQHQAAELQTQHQQQHTQQQQQQHTQQAVQAPISKAQQQQQQPLQECQLQTSCRDQQQQQQQAYHLQTHYQQHQQQQPLQEPPLHMQQQQQQQHQQQDTQQQQQQHDAADATQPFSNSHLPAYVLLVVDSTWRYAKEMFDELKWILQPQGPAIQVQLPSTNHISSCKCPAADQATSQQQQQRRTEHQQQQRACPHHCHHQHHQQQQQQQQQQPLEPCLLSAASGLYSKVPGVDGTSAKAAAAAATVAQQLADCHLQQRPGVQQQQQQQQGLSCCSTDKITAGSDAAAAAAHIAGLPDVGCRLRTEPHESCCTTYEAVARAVSCLEGSHLLPVLLKPLQCLTQLQAQFDPAIRQRTQHSSTAVVQTKSKLGMRNRLAAV